MLQAKNVVKNFGDFCALNHISINVPKGAVYGLVGPNGAGKSTIIRVFTDVFTADSGEVTWNDQQIHENPEVKQKIVVIPDDWYYFPQANIREMAGFYAGIYPSFSWERFEKLKEIFPLDEKKNIRHMSKGMQKQAAFWIAISCMPDCLILDEPVDGLDPVMRRQVWSVLLNDVEERGTTVLVSSHNLRELEDVCDHVGILNRGKVLLERSLSELQDNTVKIQVAYQNEMPEISKELNILHHTQSGRVHTYIIRGDVEKASAIFACYNPLLLDVLPLTLEEIFIYELGGEDYAIKEIVL